MYRVRITSACPSARLAAWLIDAGITVVLLAVTAVQLSGTWTIEAFFLQTNYQQLGLVVGAPFLFHLLFLGLSGRTPGMIALELQILADDGDIPTLSNLMRRPLGLPFIVASGGLVAILPWLNEQRRTIGDFLSGSRVVESLALGERISYNAWRIFKRVAKPMAPVSLALCLVLFLLSGRSGSNKDALLDAVTGAATITLLFATLIAAIKVKVTRVRLSPKGIQRAGWLGWSNKLIAWSDISYARPVITQWFPYFEVHRRNHRQFRVPMEMDSANLTARTLVANGVRFEA